MTFITYDGPSNFQEFSAADFNKADIEQNKLVFERGVPKEVSDEVAQALTSTDPEKSPIFHDFAFSMADDEEEADDEAKAAKKKAAAKKSAAKKAATSQTASGSQSEGSGDSTPTGGNGSSTSTGGTVGNGSSTDGSA
jgi:membrane protein involved in colicin uptake